MEAEEWQKNGEGLGTPISCEDWWTQGGCRGAGVHIQSKQTNEIRMIDNKHANVLDIKVYYYPRNAIFHEARAEASWNITNPRIIINLISNTVKMQYLFYYRLTHY